MKMLIILICLLSFELYADEERFTIVATGGDVEFTTDGTKWSELLVGLKLEKTAQLRIKEGYACFLTPEKNYMEITKKGDYKLTDYPVNLNTEGLRNKLASYIFEQITEHKEEKVIDEEMSGVGGVERSVDFGSAGGRLVSLYPNNGLAIDDDIEFKWTEDIIDSYKFTLVDEQGNLVFSKELRETRIVIDSDDLELKPDVCYFWSVVTPISHTNKLCVVVADEEEREKIEKDFEAIEEQLDDDSAIDNIIMADYFANQNIANRAVKHYLKAIELSGNSEAYVRLYEKYLELH